MARRRKRSAGPSARDLAELRMGKGSSEDRAEALAAKAGRHMKKRRAARKRKGK